MNIDHESVLLMLISIYAVDDIQQNYLLAEIGTCKVITMQY